MSLHRRVHRESAYRLIGRLSTEFIASYIYHCFKNDLASRLQNPKAWFRDFVRTSRTAPMICLRAGFVRLSVQLRQRYTQTVGPSCGVLVQRTELILWSFHEKFILSAERPSSLCDVTSVCIQRLSSASGKRHIFSVSGRCRAQGWRCGSLGAADFLREIERRAAARSGGSGARSDARCLAVPWAVAGVLAAICAGLILQMWLRRPGCRRPGRSQRLSMG